MKTETIYFDYIKRDITFYIGKNAQDNFDVIDKGKDDDIWFHIDGDSSCHVVAIIPKYLNSKEYTRVIKKGALLCKEHTSKYKNEKNVTIIYTNLKNVKKTEIIGCVETYSTRRIILK
jgi:predicted ribosome quality control (RQC) complex YloA/Tae2 family protein